MSGRDHSSFLSGEELKLFRQAAWPACHVVSTSMPYLCPVCGYPELGEQPRSETGGGSYEICPSCSFQFGVSDDDEGFTYEYWRKRWVDMGMPWDKGSTAPPAGWNALEQLRRI